MPVIFAGNKSKIKNIPHCCGEEMKVAGDWVHCFKCNNKFIHVHENKTKPIIYDLISEIVRSEELKWKELEPIIHDIWRESITDGEYSAKVPDEWID